MVLGHLHMVIAVNFNPITLIKELLGPRFTQSWQRSRTGGWGSFLTELSLLINIVPAIGAIFLSNWKKNHVALNGFVLACVGFVFFCGFSLGSRYVFATYLIVFMAAFTLCMPRITMSRAITVVLPTVLTLLAVSIFVLEFRLSLIHI